ncbi:MAG: cell division protein FtsZ [Rickettsiaceae bacterium]|nr:cell division protein FtsZ [Rickettsiaceae bacterium]
MALNFKAPENIILKPVITVFGVGGAGTNAVSNMINSNLQGANFVVANTDAQALEHSICVNKIQLGMVSTRGLGAGASPEVGQIAAEESEAEIRSYLEGSNMVFITCGMGGGTGTGGSPVIAKIAKELGILTVGVVTKPFLFEGAKRMKAAGNGLRELQKYVDTLIVIPNQNLFRIANENTTFTDAFKMADEVLHAGVRGVTDLIIMPGLINLDFADIKTVMSEMGKAMMGTGEADGEERAIKAAEAAIANPLLDNSSMSGAKGVLINITGGEDMTLYEVDSAANRIREEIGDSEANIIFGSTFNPELSGIIRVSVVATGIEAEQAISIQEEEVATNNNISDTQEENENLLNSNTLDEELIPKYHNYDSSEEGAISNKSSEENITSEEAKHVTNNMDWCENNHEANTGEKAKSESVKGNHDEMIKPVKTSLLRRMWNSLKATDTTNNQKKREEEKKQQNISPSITNSSTSEVQEVPEFFRKK